jgi:hypothetical protein
LLSVGLGSHTTLAFAFVLILAGNMTELKWRKTLLETPSGFALFAVDEDVLKEPDVPIQFYSFPTLVSSLPFSSGPCN